jgi:hypothetical protein
METGEEKEANEAAKGDDEEEKAPQTIRRIDAETGMRAMCSGSRKARARSEAGTAAKD